MNLDQSLNLMTASTAVPAFMPAASASNNMSFVDNGLTANPFGFSALESSFLSFNGLGVPATAPGEDLSELDFAEQKQLRDVVTAMLAIEQAIAVGNNPALPPKVAMQALLDGFVESEGLIAKIISDAETTDLRASQLGSFSRARRAASAPQFIIRMEVLRKKQDTLLGLIQGFLGTENAVSLPELRALLGGKSKPLKGPQLQSAGSRQAEAVAGRLGADNLQTQLITSINQRFDESLRPLDSNTEDENLRRSGGLKLSQNAKTMIEQAQKILEQVMAQGPSASTGSIRIAMNLLNRAELIVNFNQIAQVLGASSDLDSLSNESAAIGRLNQLAQILLFGVYKGRNLEDAAEQDVAITDLFKSSDDEEGLINIGALTNRLNRQLNGSSSPQGTSSGLLSGTSGTSGTGSNPFAL